MLPLGGCADLDGLGFAFTPKRSRIEPHAAANQAGHNALARRPGATGTALSRPAEPNARWCADYKGEFMLGDRRYCYPLTITDFASRYLLTCEALSTTQEKFAFTVFERTFKEFGLPGAIRTDKRGAVRVRPRDLRAEQIVGVVAAARYSD